MTEFKYFLNRQGVRGPQGPQGEKGFSPDISVEKDTLSEYVLRITNEGGYFLTANLREHKEDRGGTYIRYDRATGVMYAGDAELATTNTLGVIRIAGDDDFTGKAEDAAVTPAQIQDYTTAKIAEVNQRIDSLDANNVKVTGDQAIDGRKVFRDRIESNYVYTDHVYGSNIERIFANEDFLAIGNTQKPTVLYSKGAGVTLNGNTDYVLTQSRVTAGDGVAIEKTTSGIKISSTAQGDVTLAGDNSFTGNNTFDGVSTFNGDTWINSLKVGTSLTNQQDKKFLTQGNITAGDNVTVEETTDGVKISSTGGSTPANMVTTDTEQTILGTKIFNSGATFFQRGFILGRLESIRTSDSISRRILTYNDYSLEVGINDRTTKILGSQVVDGSNKRFLVQGSVTAGSDNLVIADTTDGVQITCNAPTNAQIEALQRLINDLSTKIDNLTTRLNNLEEVIDGGVAGSIYPADPQKIDAEVVQGQDVSERSRTASEDINITEKGI